MAEDGLDKDEMSIQALMAMAPSVASALGGGGEVDRPPGEMKSEAIAHYRPAPKIIGGRGSDWKVLLLMVVVIGVLLWKD